MFKSLLFSGFLILMICLAARTFYLSQSSAPVKECKATDTDFVRLTDERLQRFQRALQFQTVSKAPHDYNREELQKFGDFLIASFPKVHSELQWERINNYSFLYYVKGSNPALRPYLLMSHMDVVPATNLDIWEAPPFSGQVKDGFIYGRGSIDVKQTLMSILEATEYFLMKGIKPVRSYYIAFGHDEEVHGADGAGMIVKRLKEKGVTEFEFILDEGLPVSDGIVNGVNNPVASIGVTEKGQVVLKLSVKGPPGHSSMPPKESTIGILAAAVHKLESNPHPSMLGRGVETDMFERLVPEMNFPESVIMSNIWLFKPILSWFLSLKPVTSAMVRTVTAVTMFDAGVKFNVIPPEATAVVNHRIHPSQTIEEVVEYDRNIINDDRVSIEIIASAKPHPTAGYSDEDFGYQVMKTSIRQIWPKAVVVPGIMLGNTDTRLYLNFTNDVYRFSPTYMFPGDPDRFHGNNERISVKNYEQVINFYVHVITNANQAELTPPHTHHQDL